MKGNEMKESIYVKLVSLNYSRKENDLVNEKNYQNQTNLEKYFDDSQVIGFD